MSKKTKIMAIHIKTAFYQMLDIQNWISNTHLIFM